MTSIFYSNSTHHVTLKISHTECQKFWILASQCDLHRHRLRVFQFLINGENAEKCTWFFVDKVFLCACEVTKTCDTCVIDPQCNVRPLTCSKIMFDANTIKIHAMQNTIRIQSECSQKKNILLSSLSPNAPPHPCPSPC